MNTATDIVTCRSPVDRIHHQAGCGVSDTAKTKAAVLLGGLKITY
jgi:hypothetical protein